VEAAAVVSSASASEQIVGVLSRTGPVRWIDEGGFLGGTA
jgi:hypothetical protein